MSQHEVSILIGLDVDKETFRQQAKSDPVKAAAGLEAELKSFENWMVRQGMEQLSSVEKQIVREYLGFKLVT